MKILYNTLLAEEMKLTAEQRDAINDLHHELNKIFDEELKVKTGRRDATNKQLKKWDNEIKEIEFKLQEAWGFKQDSKYHRYWYDQPLCTCPKMDNKELVGTEHRLIDYRCPVHGDGGTNG